MVAAGRIAPQYPADADSAKVFLSPAKLGAYIGLSEQKNRNLRIESIALHRWSNTVTAQSGVSLFAIDPNREVYEVTTSFSAPYHVRDNVWAYGHRTYIIDAETGHVYLSRTWGDMTSNDGKIRADLMKTHRMSAPRIDPQNR